MNYESPNEFGFRRRCGWCGRELRLWQLHLCKLCNQAAKYDVSPPVRSGSGWFDKADKGFWE